MEVDLSYGAQMVFLRPNIMMSVHDFHKEIEVVLLTRGRQDAESKLLIRSGGTA